MSLFVLAIAGFALWKADARQRAIDQLAAEEFTLTETSLWDKAGRDARGFLRSSTWAAYHVGDTTLHRKPSPVKLRPRLEPLAGALRSVNPGCILISAACPDIRNLDALKGVSRLRWLEINCPALQNLDGLRDLSRLEYVALTNCRKLETVDTLRSLSRLKEVALLRCDSLRNIDGLKALQNVERITLVNCDSLESVGHSLVFAICGPSTFPGQMRFCPSLCRRSKPHAQR
jgi:hypothetical protein